MDRATTNALAGLAAAALAGCGSGGYAPTNLQTAPPPPAPANAAPASPATARTTVTIRDLAFGPHTITTTVGRPVAWVNRDDVRHNVTTQDGATIASPDIAPGGRFVYVPARPARLRYYCTIHPSTMSGEVVVLAR